MFLLLASVHLALDQSAPVFVYPPESKLHILVLLELSLNFYFVLIVQANSRHNGAYNYNVVYCDGHAN
jgi:prepilin-type processing-associated H-X9-DG protein